jgi:hypothetical protein
VVLPPVGKKELMGTHSMIRRFVVEHPYLARVILVSLLYVCAGVAAVIFDWTLGYTLIFAAGAFQVAWIAVDVGRWIARRRYRTDLRRGAARDA